MTNDGQKGITPPFGESQNPGKMNGLLLERIDAKLPREELHVENTVVAKIVEEAVHGDADAARQQKNGNVSRLRARGVMSPTQAQEPNQK